MCTYFIGFIKRVGEKRSNARLAVFFLPKYIASYLQKSSVVIDVGNPDNDPKSRLASPVLWERRSRRVSSLVRYGSTNWKSGPRMAVTLAVVSNLERKLTVTWPYTVKNLVI